MRDSLAPSSHSGATVHAYGVKVPQDSFGMDGTEIPMSAGGERISVMREAMRAGLAVGIVNSGHLAEPGTAVFLASSPNARTTQVSAQSCSSIDRT
jgi:alkaline phosphatase